tara:strand:+ start:521 stop:1192 length:672 start_codon:yes stop_codon:yes gene_type:complete
MKVLTPYPGVVHVIYPKQTMLAKAFMRMQEFYESGIPGFKDKHFTRDEFKKAYAQMMGTGVSYEEFTYYDDWGGFNVPGDVADRFMWTFEPDFMEAGLVRTVKDHRPTDDKPYYVIGTFESGGDSIIDHELSHAFWHLHSDYRKMMQGMVESLPKTFRHTIRHHLLEMGYCESVLDDETAAYLATSTVLELDDLVDQADIPWKQALTFQRTFRSYLENKSSDK